VSQSAESNARLGRRQGELVAALVAGGDPPAGLNADDVGAATRSIALKRLRELRLAWPTLCRDLEPGLEERFISYATERPPPLGGAIADGCAFARHLRRHRELPQSARIELLTVQARSRVRGDRTIPRRGPALRVTTLGEPPRLLAVLHFPQLRERWLKLRIPWT
jgi:hypothetical protein